MLVGLASSLSLGLEDRIVELEQRLAVASPSLREVVDALARLERLIADLPAKLVEELDRAEWSVAAPATRSIPKRRAGR